MSVIQVSSNAIKMAYLVIKAFALALSLSAYVLLLTTIFLAHLDGGWIIITINKYHEGFLELALLTAFLPLVAFIQIKESIHAIFEIRKIKKKLKQSKDKT